jgi:acetyltransferase-like isoleucine patch superfamily enzyme
MTRASGEHLTAGRLSGAISRLAGSKPVEVLLTVVVYGFFVAVLAASLTPSAWLLILGSGYWLPGFGAAPAAAGAAFALALNVALALYSYFVVGILLQGVLIRLLSLGIKPGTYPAVSGTTVRWLLISGIYTVTIRTILPMVLVSALTNLYFRIIGCKMGKNVKINTPMLNDAYLLTLGDNVVVGGAADLSCHLFEHNHLVLGPISVGDNTLIGAHCYVSPGVSIGANCVIGLHSFIRSGKQIPDNTVVTSVGSTNVRTANSIERGRIR